jgi:unsaturated rhamnogalacturonyl hydrolase
MNNQIKHIIVSVLLILVTSQCVFNKEKAVSENLPWSQRMAETIMYDYEGVWQVGHKPGLSWTYTNGLVSDAFLALWEKTEEKKYYEYAKAYADTLIDEKGIIRTYKLTDYNIDKINSGKMLFTFYEETKDERYRIAMDTLRKQLAEHPRVSEGGFWHKKRYPHQMWLDGLYMGGPFYARYGMVFNEPEAIDDVINWFTLIEMKTRNEKNGLLYHAWDESREQRWANKKNGLVSHFWGRGIGWYAMALVDLLDYTGDHEREDEVIAIINRLAEAVLKVQDKESGCWYQVLDKPDGEGNYLEGSATAMFTYFLLKAVQKGYINDSYLEYANKAYKGMIANLIKVREDGGVVISPVCAVAGLGGNPYRDGSYEYYINEKKFDNDSKAVGPFILASLLYEDQL